MSRSPAKDRPEPGRASAFPRGLSPFGTARQRLDAAATYRPLWGARAEATRAQAAGGGPAADFPAADLPAADAELYAFVATETAGWAVGLDPDDRRRFEALVAALLVATEQGSTRIAITPAEAALLARIPEIAGPSNAAPRPPFVIDEGFLAPQRLFVAERRLAEAVHTRLLAPAATFAADAARLDAALAAVAATASPRPTEEQLAAARQALSRQLGVITGGPGTGKTTIVFTLVRALVRLGLAPSEIALGAPTGKAANRLGEAVRAGLARLGEAGQLDPADARLLADPPSAETLHRLLRHSPSARSFAHGEAAPLPHAAIIVDESSMVDLGLMDRLLAATARGAVLVLVGDADQLPSVEAGSVFRDLAGTGVALKASHRMDEARPEGRQLLTLAAAVRDGARDLGRLIEARADLTSLAGVGAEIVPAAWRPQLFDRWIEEKLGHAAIAAVATRTFALDDGAHGDPNHATSTFAPDDERAITDAWQAHQKGRVLAVTRVRPTGAEALNLELHQRFLQRFASVRAPFAPGEPVLMLRNDYERGLWNGDQGMVVNVARDGVTRLGVVFNVAGRLVPFPLDSLRDSVGHAFALTVHKSQGSEYDDVLFVLPDEPVPLFSRDLIYTAITRSRRSVVLSGDVALLPAGVANVQRRSSGFTAALSGFTAALSGSAAALSDFSALHRALPPR